MVCFSQLIFFFFIDVALWEMIWELISRVTWPSPQNPFEINFEYLDQIPLPQALFLTGGLLEFLQTLWVQAEPNVAFIDDGNEYFNKVNK